MMEIYVLEEIFQGRHYTICAFEDFDEALAYLTDLTKAHPDRVYIWSILNVIEKKVLGCDICGAPRSQAHGNYCGTGCAIAGGL
jgi:hypothetical protein